MPSVLVDFVSCFSRDDGLRTSLLQVLRMEFQDIVGVFDRYIRLLERHFESCNACARHVPRCAAGSECLFTSPHSGVDDANMSIISGLAPIAKEQHAPIDDVTKGRVCTECRQIAHADCVTGHGCCLSCVGVVHESDLQPWDDPVAMQADENYF